MAEKRFKAIAARVYKREGWDRWDTDIDYIEQNINTTAILNKDAIEEKRQKNLN